MWASACFTYQNSAAVWPILSCGLLIGHAFRNVELLATSLEGAVTFICKQAFPVKNLKEYCVNLKVFKT